MRMQVVPQREKLFRKTARKMHPKNIVTTDMRGGIRM